MPTYYVPIASLCLHLIGQLQNGDRRCYLGKDCGRCSCIIYRRYCRTVATKLQFPGSHAAWKEEQSELLESSGTLGVRPETEVDVQARVLSPWGTRLTSSISSSTEWVNQCFFSAFPAVQGRFVEAQSIDPHLPELVACSFSLKSFSSFKSFCKFLSPNPFSIVLLNWKQPEATKSPFVYYRKGPNKAGRSSYSFGDCPILSCSTSHLTQTLPPFNFLS